MIIERETTTDVKIEVMMPRQCTTAKPPDGTGTEDQKRQTGDETRDVRVKNRRKGTIVAFADGGLRQTTETQFLADAFVDQHVRVNGHAERQRDGGDAGQRQRSLKHGTGAR